MSDFSRQVVRQLRAQSQDLNQIRGRAIGPTMGETYAMFLGLPSLRGFWPMNNMDQAFAVYDLSGQGRTLASAEGTPALNWDLTTALVSYVERTGAGYWSRASEAGLQITGTEGSVKSTHRGLTLGGWFYFNSTAAALGMLSKTGASANNAYWLYLPAGGAVQMGIGSGAANQYGAFNAVPSATTWHFIVGRYTPSTELAVFQDGVKGVPNTTGIYASINTSADAFEVGRIFDSAGSRLNGNVALLFLCAAALPDTLLAYLFNRTRWAFSV